MPQSNDVSRLKTWAVAEVVLKVRLVSNYLYGLGTFESVLFLSSVFFSGMGISTTKNEHDKS